MEMEKKERGAGAGAVEDIQTFLVKMEEAASAITNIFKNVKRICNLQQKHLTAAQKSDSDELENLMGENTTLAKTACNVLKIEQDKQAVWAAGGSGPPPASELHMRRTQLTAQSQRFFYIWEQYSVGQAEYWDKTREMLIEGMRPAYSTLADEEIEAMLDEGKMSEFGKSMPEQDQVTRQHLGQLQAQHNEFVKMKKAVAQINSMFVKVHNLTAKQTRMVDAISAPVTIRAAADVERGMGQLDTVKRHIWMSRRCKIILGIALALFFIYVVYYFFYKFGLI